MRKRFDVIVVGSGAGGGMFAYVLARAGASVLLIDAGGHGVDRDFRRHQWPWQFPNRGAYQLDDEYTIKFKTRTHFAGEGTRDEVTSFDGSVSNTYHNDHFWAKRRDWKYTFPADKPYYWARVRALGGKTNCWSANVIRWGPREWKPFSYDGFGVDWPIDYDEIEPWYTRTEELIGVSGPDTRSEHVPTGKWLPTIPGRCGQLRVARAAREKFGWYAFQHPKAAITRDYQGRSACHYCGPCTYGCDVGAKFTTTGVLLPPAIATGRLTILPNAIVRDVLVDRHARASGVSFVDRYTFAEGEQKASVVVLAASAIETARILLNSKSSRFPAGLANSSGQVGKHLVDNVTAVVAGYLPEFADRQVTNEDGWGSAMMIAPFINTDEGCRSSRFLRRYILDISSGFSMGAGRRRNSPHFGAALKRDIKRWYGSGIAILGTGEALESNHNYVEIDPDVKDAWGIPAARIHMTFGSNEEAMVDDIVRRSRDLIESAGGVVTSWSESPSIPGEQIHEQGTCRMGDDPKRFVTNRWGQCHDVPNLWLGDGSVNVTPATEAPTLTILALAMRNATRLVDEVRKKNLSL